MAMQYANVNRLTSEQNLDLFIWMQKTQQEGKLKSITNKAQLADRAAKDLGFRVTGHNVEAPAKKLGVITHTTGPQTKLTRNRKKITILARELEKLYTKMGEPVSEDLLYLVRDGRPSSGSNGQF